MRKLIVIETCRYEFEVENDIETEQHAEEFFTNLHNPWGIG